MTGLAEQFRAVEGRIAAACARAGRDPASVRLLPVTKTQPAAVVRAAAALGYRAFGENRVQELVAKQAALAEVPGLEWVVIGHLQTNKAKPAARHARAVQSLESLKLAKALQSACEELDRTLDVLIEVNTSGEDSKFGLVPADVIVFAKELRAFDRLRPLGLMTLALPSDDPALVAPCFKTLAAVQTQLRYRDGEGWDELSMGMSGDFELAVELGSTCVRVGTALFGARAAG
ncbi:MAG: YggS family pyridoxal phosphate-dependent enzyme [Propionibacteriaceae bacterium]|nr:YggS family pyridoxal phosphate-dependent enzyme [Propionibacteriaceae bacterium]